MEFPPRPWAWEVGHPPSGSYGLPPDPVPDDPVEFLDNCSSWWSWLESATADELEQFARTGRLPRLAAGTVDFRLIGDDGWSEVVVPAALPLKGLFRPRAMFEVEVV